MVLILIPLIIVTKKTWKVRRSGQGGMATLHGETCCLGSTPWGDSTPSPHGSIRSLVSEERLVRQDAVEVTLGVPVGSRGTRRLFRLRLLLLLFAREAAVRRLGP